MNMKLSVESQKSFFRSLIREGVLVVVLFVVSLLSSASQRTTAGTIERIWPTLAKEVSVMAPLLIGDPRNPEAENSKAEWANFERELREAKNTGITAVSTDIWWGLVEVSEGRFNWAYYLKMAETIKRVGLKWVPILSFHKLGGNVGDRGEVPLPEYIWTRPVLGQKGDANQSPLMYRSEQGHLSKESVSVWGTRVIAKDYARVMQSFRDTFSAYAGLISEINLSLGPTGELRYPSYNAHDSNAGYPTRGALQAYSDLAVASFREFVRKKYGSLDNVKKAWNFELGSFESIQPPNPSLMENFFAKGEHFSPYGKDFFDWYNQSLNHHAEAMFLLAERVFGAKGSAMRNASLGGKIPGVHWLTGSTRLAELAAGLIRTSYSDWYSDESGFGYRETLKAFRQRGRMKHIVHFTAIELNDMDHEGSQPVFSRAKTLTQRIGKAVADLRPQVRGMQDVSLKGENALSPRLYEWGAWDNMIAALKTMGYDGVTLLRLNELISDPGKRGHLEGAIKALGIDPAATTTTVAAAAVSRKGGGQALRCSALFLR